MIDYEMGNVDSVVRALEEVGANVKLTRKKCDIQNASHVVLPGVGSFNQGMAKLVGFELDNILFDEVVTRGKPFLGICVGMQLLASSGTENEQVKGLGWLPGKVVKLKPRKANERIPHLGWNEVIHSQPESPLFEGIRSGLDFFFANGYHFLCEDMNNVMSTTPYCGGFVSSVVKNNIFGVQFHPEKSQKGGLTLLRNFVTF